MLGADAVHGGAEGAVVIEGQDALALRSKALGQPIHEVDLSADGELGAGRGLLYQGDYALGRAESIGFLTDFPTALSVNDDLDAGIFRAHIVNLAGQEALVHGAVALPEQNAAGGQLDDVRAKY